MQGLPRPARRPGLTSRCVTLLLALCIPTAMVAARVDEGTGDGTAMRDTAILPAQDDLAPAVTLATIGPGEIYWQRFGHNTLIVTPPGEGGAVSYNFGYFDFEQPGFFRRFILGRMLYHALAIPAGRDLAGYVDEDRAVALQELALLPAQASHLAERLAVAVLPENRDYLYEYFRANCSTRVRDALDEALGGALKRQTAGRSRGFTYRMHALRLTRDDFWLSLGMDLGLGPDADRRLTFWEEMFIPEMLRRHLREVVNDDGQPLVRREYILHRGGLPEPGELPPDRRLPFLLTGLAAAAFLLWLSARAPTRSGTRRALAATATALHLLFGLAGAMLLFLWLGTDHIAAHRNENLFLLNPLGLALAVSWARHQRTRVGETLAWLVALSAAGALAVKVLPATFIQQNVHWSLLLLPIHLALLVAWRRRDMS